MKKKFLIKENELDGIVKNILKEYDNQLELDFNRTKNSDNTMLELIQGRYNDIVVEVREILSNCQDSSCYDRLEEVHRKIFSISRVIYRMGSIDDTMVDKFNDLEDYLTDFMETFLNYITLKEDLDASGENLKDFLNQ